MKHIILLMFCVYPSFSFAQFHELMIQAGKISKISFIKYSPDGQHLIAADSAKIIIWNVRSGKVEHFLEVPPKNQLGHIRGPISSVSISQKGKYVAASHSKGKKFITLWDLSLNRSCEIKTNKAVTSIAFNQKETEIFVAGNSKVIATYSLSEELSKKIVNRSFLDAPSAPVRQSAPFKGKVNSLALSQDGKLLASAGKGKEINIWAEEKLEKTGSLALQGKQITQLSFSKDGKRLLSGDASGNVDLWDVENYKKLHTFAMKGESIAKALISPDASYALCLTESGKFKKWDLANYELLKEENKAGSNSLLDINNTGDYFCFLAGNTEFQINSFSKNNQGPSAAEKVGFQLASEEARAGDLAVHMYDSRSFAYIKPLRFPSTVNSLSLEFNIAGDLLANFTDEQLIKIWNLEEAKLESMVKLPIEKKQTHGIYFSPDLNFIALADGRSMKLVRFKQEGKYGLFEYLDSLEIRKQERFKPSTLYDYWVGKSKKTTTKLAFVASENRKYLGAISPDDELHIWKISDDDQSIHKKTLPKKALSQTIKGLAFSSDGRFLCIYGKNKIFLYDNIKEVFIKKDINPLRPKKTKRKGPEEDVLKKARKTRSQIYSIVPAFDGTHFVAYISDFLVHIHGKTGRTKITEIDRQSLIPGFFIAHLQESTGNIFDDPGVQQMFSFFSSKHCVEKKMGIFPLTHEIMLYKYTSSNRGNYNQSLGRFPIPGEDRNRAFLSSDVFAIGKDGIRLAQFISDGRIRIFNLEAKEKVLDIISRGNAYVMLTPDKYYKTERAGTELIGFKVGGKLLPFEEMDIHYNRPHEVLKSLSDSAGIIDRSANMSNKIKAYEAAYEKRLQRLGYELADFRGSSYHPGFSIIEFDKIPLRTNKASLDLSIRINSNIKKLKVWVNSVPIYGREGQTINPIGKQYKFSIPLSRGNNDIQLSVVDKRGQESFREQIPNLFYEAEKKEKANLHLFAIGVSQFEDTALNLKYAAKDAIDISEAFQSKTDLFNKVYVHTILNEEATLENILALREKLEKTSIHDQVIFFVASHGILDTKLDYYLATHDMDFLNPATRGIAYELLENLLDGTPARKRLLLIDACHSGEVDKDNIKLVEEEFEDHSEELIFRSGFKKAEISKTEQGLENSFELMQALFEDLKENSGTKVISAAGGLEYALEGGSYQNGVFTYSLIKGLKEQEADLNQDGSISVHELQNFLIAKVSEISRGNQTPTSRVENYKSNWTIW